MKKIKITENDFNVHTAMVALAKNPNCPIYIFEQLSKSRSSEVLTALSRNPSCPTFILEKIITKHREYDEIYKNPNCPSYLIKSYIKIENNSTIDMLECPIMPTDILEWYYENAEYFDNDHYKMGTIESEIWKKVQNNPNAPDYVINDMSTSGLMDKIKANPYYYKKYLERYIEIAKKYDNKEFLDFLVKTVENLNRVRVYSDSEISKKINSLLDDIVYNNIAPIINMVLDRNCPNEIIYLVSLIKFDNPIINKLISTKLLEVKRKYNAGLKGVKFRQRISFEESMTLRIKHLINNDIVEFGRSGSKESMNFTSKIGKDDKFDILDSSRFKEIKITIKSDNFPLIEKDSFKDESGKHVYYGEYPYEKANWETQTTLDLLYSLEMLKKTSKVYKMMFGTVVKQYPEFYFGERKFIYLDDMWYEVKPMLWDLDEDMQLLISHNKISYIPREGFLEFVKYGFKKDIMSGSVIITKDEKRENSSANEKFRERKKLSEEIKKAQENKEQEDLNKEIDELEKQIQDALLLLVQKKAMMSNASKYHTVKVNEELLYTEVDGHYEIKSIYIPYLKYMNLSLIDTTNLKVCGIDFRGTNISINPQKVWNKDLSYAKFDDENIMFGDFTGCILNGTDISNESFAIGLESAITDENTLYPTVKRGIS